MIKDKITPELKNRFLQEIQDTIRDGNEHGLLICSDEKGKLSTSNSLKGEQHRIFLKSLKDQCKFKIQGEFHTHPHATEAKIYIEEKFGRMVQLEDARKIVLDIAKKKNVSLTGPSYGDTLGTIMLRYGKDTLGTTCIGTDLEPDKVECWSTKNSVTEDDFDTATREFFGGNVNGSPLEWVRNLFDKEVIYLKEKDNRKIY